MYYALEQIHVLPNVNYMAKIRNTEEMLEVDAAHTPADKEHHG
jgi:molybdopterin-containing oxidoreductase family iron-sulfur binding subunit